MINIQTRMRGGIGRLIQDSISFTKCGFWFIVFTLWYLVLVELHLKKSRNRLLSYLNPTWPLFSSSIWSGVLRCQSQIAQGNLCTREAPLCVCISKNGSGLIFSHFIHLRIWDIIQIILMEASTIGTISYYRILRDFLDSTKQCY